MAAKTSKVPQPSNPLLGTWRTPFGMTPWSKLKPEHYAPAFDAALTAHTAEIDAIAAAKAKPTFANTILTLEKAGRLLDRVASAFFTLTSAHTNEALQAIERDIRPKLAKHASAINLDPRLFARVDDLFDRRDELGLDAEQMRVLERSHLGFVRSGAQLNAKDKTRIAAIDHKLASLTTRFSQNILADEQSWRLVLDAPEDLAGLPPAVIAAAARAAEDAGLKGKHVITLARSSVESFLQFSSRRDLREEAFKAWIKRGENAGKTDNRGLIAEIVQLRAERAKLLGYPTYAHYRLDDTMAKTPSAVMGLLNEVWGHAVSTAAGERDALQKIARAEGGNFEIAAWDWRYYAEKERKARYDLDEGEVRPYFELDNIIAAAFDTAHRLFGLSFHEIKGAPVYQEDVRVWEVKGRDDEHVGVFVGDYFARPSKRSGAWMNAVRSQHNLAPKPQRPIVHNTMNFARGADGAATLLSFDDARTLFHEFGHALHGLMSNVTYPSIAGTHVSRDFVELPSQLYEHWIGEPAVLKKFARHTKTGKPMPESLLQRLNAARNFNQGFATVEYTAAAIIDMDLHAMADPGKLDVTQFEKATLKRIGMPREIVLRHRLPHFSHIMGGYAAGYYSYLWSEVMDADAYGAFQEKGNPFDKATAKRLAENVYSAGNRQEPGAAYLAFRGRPPKVDALLKKRGFE